MQIFYNFDAEAPSPEGATNFYWKRKLAMILHSLILLLSTHCIISNPLGEHENDRDIQAILHNFTPETFMNEMRSSVSGQKITNTINEAISNGRFYSWLSHTSFTESIRLWPKDLKKTALGRTIIDGDFDALSKILRHSADIHLDLKDLIIQAVDAHRLDMVVELVKYGDPDTVELAFVQVTKHDEAIQYLQILLENTKSKFDGYYIFMKFAQNAVLEGNIGQIEIFLRNLNYPYAKRGQTVMHSISFQHHILLQIMATATHARDPKVINLVISHLTKFSRYYPRETGWTIIYDCVGPERLLNFKYLLEQIKDRPDRDFLVTDFFEWMAFNGDMELIDVFFGVEEFYKVKTVFPPRETDTYPVIWHLMNEFQDPSTWILINGILAASDARNEEMMTYLISKISDVTEAGNALFMIAVIAGKQNFVQALLGNDRFIESNIFYHSIDDGISLASIFDRVDILEALEKIRVMRPNFNFAAAAA